MHAYVIIIWLAMYVYSNVPINICAHILFEIKKSSWSIHLNGIHAYICTRQMV